MDNIKDVLLVLALCVFVSELGRLLVCCKD